MADRIVTTDGAWKLSGDRPFKKLLGDLIQKHLSQEPARQAEARRAILDHPYLELQERHLVEQSGKKERLKTCKKRLEGFIVRLERGEINLVIPSDMTQGTALTSQKLRGRPLRLLDLDENWLLIAVERHPYGGSGKVLDQYWLYSKRDRKAYLLRWEQRLEVKWGPVKVKGSDGVWREPDRARQDSFESQVRLYLGNEALQKINRCLQFKDEELCPSHPELLGECQTITGIDYMGREQARQSAAEKRYDAKLGPKTFSEPPGITFFPGSAKFIISQQSAPPPKDPSEAKSD